MNMRDLLIPFTIMKGKFYCSNRLIWHMSKDRCIIFRRLRTVAHSLIYPIFVLRVHCTIEVLICTCFDLHLFSSKNIILSLYVRTMHLFLILQLSIQYLIICIHDQIQIIIISEHAVSAPVLQDVQCSKSPNPRYSFSTSILNPRYSYYTSILNPRYS